MRGVPTLIRLAQQEVDERRSDLVRIAAARASAAEALDTHDAEAAREAAVSMTSALESCGVQRMGAAGHPRKGRLQQRFAELGRSETTARRVAAGRDRANETAGNRSGVGGGSQAGDCDAARRDAR